MPSQDKKPSLIKRGLIISRTLIFKLLIRRAGGYVYQPYRIINLTRKAIAKAKKYENFQDFGVGMVATVLLFGQMLKYWASGDYKGLETSKVFMIIGTILYFVSPVDMVPDYIPFLGLLDDISLLAWLFSTLSVEIQQFVVWKKNEFPNVNNLTYSELYELAQARAIQGRSKMDKAELIEALSKNS